MCTMLTIVAYHNQCRLIARCEHGTIHLSWDIGTVRLRELDFKTLAHCIQQHANSDQTSISLGWCTLDRDARNNCRLWIGQVGLVMAARDFVIFADLIAEATDILSSPASTQPASLLAYPLLTVDADLLAVN